MMNSDQEPRSKPPLPRTLSSNRVNFTVSRSSLNDLLNPSKLESSNNHLEVPDAATSYYNSYSHSGNSAVPYGTMYSSSCSPTPANRNSHSPTVYRRAKSDRLEKILSKNKQTSSSVDKSVESQSKSPSATRTRNIKSSYGSSPAFSNRKRNSVESLNCKTLYHKNIQKS